MSFSVQGLVRPHSRYAGALRHRTVTSGSIGNLLGSLPNGMLPVALAVRGATAGDGFGSTGLVLAAFGAGALVAPWRGRLVDRRGARPVIARIAAFRVLALLGFVALPSDANIALVSVLSLLCGASLPPLASTLRRRIARLELPEEQEQAAAALVALVQELTFVVGPLVAAGAQVAWGSSAPFALAAVLTVAGSVVFLRGEPDRRPEPRRPRPVGATVLGPVVRTLIAISLPFGMILGSVEVVLAAGAVDNGQRHATGLLIAVFAASSATAGLAYGAIAPAEGPGARPFRRVVLLASVACGLVGTACLITGYAGLFVIAALVGAPVAPLFTAIFLLSGRVPDEIRVEAGSWVVAAGAAGNAGGAAVAGGTISLFGWRAGLLVTLSGAVGMLLAALIADRSSPPPTHRPTTNDARWPSPTDPQPLRPTVGRPAAGRARPRIR